MEAVSCDNLEEKGPLQIRYDPDQKACFPAGPAPYCSGFQMVKIQEVKIENGRTSDYDARGGSQGLTILPGMVLHFDINRPKSEGSRRAGYGGRPETVSCGPETSWKLWSLSGDLFQVGYSWQWVKQLVKLPGKVVRVLVEAWTGTR